MSDEYPDRGEEEHIDPQRAPEALNDALDTLAGMLDASPNEAWDTLDLHTSEGPPVSAAADASGHGGPSGKQCPIAPLEHQAIPATELPAEVIDQGWIEELPPFVCDNEACQRLIQRLASEIEIIVQTSVEEALREASKSIRVKVKNHIDIMLPEMINEIARINARKDT